MPSEQRSPAAAASAVSGAMPSPATTASATSSSPPPVRTTVASPRGSTAATVSPARTRTPFSRKYRVTKAASSGS